MEFPPALGTIEGAKNLRDWFGYWPSFHDAEVILLHLNRSDASTLLWSCRDNCCERHFDSSDTWNAERGFITMPGMCDQPEHVR